MTNQTLCLLAVCAGATAHQVDAQSLTEDLKILPDPGQVRGLFGDELDLHDGVAVVASKGVFTLQIPGEAGLYDAATGAKLADLPLPVTPAERLVVFGCAIGADRAAVGTRVDGQPVYTNTVWLFDTTAPAAPTLIDQIQPSDADFSDAFGDAIAIDGPLMLVGAPGDSDNGGLSGSAYLFDTATGAERAKLKPADGAALDEFGFSVDLDTAAGLAIVGARRRDGLTGVAFLFDVSDPSNPVELATLMSSDRMPGDQYGFDVAVEGTVALVGAIFNDEAGFDAGAAYVYDLSTPTAPVEIAKIIPSDADPTDDFGWTVNLEDGLALITSRTDDDIAPGGGSGYLFDMADPANPVELTKIVPTDSEANDVFGWSAAFDGDTMLIGASQEDDAAENAGAAYVFAVPAEPCPADTNGDGELTPADFNAWILAFNNQTSACDQNGDGLCNPGDFNAWVLNFNAGC
ncbi:MAG: GC-type dockerin domain-anchored protein [Planctomycetota bacterium]